MLQGENNASLVREEAPVRPSFYRRLEEVKEQVEFHTFHYQDRRFGLELCKIITEVLFLDPGREMQIGEDLVPIHVVQEIFAHLGGEHLELVISNFRELEGKIKKKKAYLRAALYNSAFEIEAHYTNLAK